MSDLMNMIAVQEEAQGQTPPDTVPAASSMMPDVDYLTFFGLQQNPFSDAVNPSFFYKTNTHERAYMRMRMAVEQDVSLAMVSGRSGTGKTMLTQMLMNSLSRDRYELALVLINPGMSRTAMLRELALELRLDLPDKPCYAQDYLRMIQDYIIDLHLQNRKLVLVIDECQFLRAEALHTLRTLSNIETPEKKLLTCLLFAEPRFMKRLEHPNYESLRTRMYYHTELQPLDAEECRQYIKYRVLVAGGEDEMFDPLAYTAIHYCSGGVCRKINKVCALAMTEAYMDRVPIIDAQMIGRCGSML